MFDKVLGEIGAKRDHYALFQEAWMLRKWIEELAQEKENLAMPRELDTEIVYKNLSIHTTLTFIPRQIIEFEL